MHNSPKVAIVIPTFNRKWDVQKAIDSALNQTYENLEILVSDNKSSDDSYEYLLEKYGFNKKLKIHQQQVNIGPIRNWEYCINSVDSDFIKILWSDDELLPNTIESCLAKIEADVAFAFCPATIVTDKKKIYCYASKFFKSKIKSKNFIKLAMLEMNIPYSPGAILARTSDLKDYFQYFHSLTFDAKCEMIDNGIGPDLLMLLFVASRYEYIGYAADTSVIFNAGDDSITRKSGVLRINKYYDVVKLVFSKTISSNYNGFILPNIWAHSIDCYLRYKKKYTLNFDFDMVLDLFAYLIAVPLFLLVLYRRYLQPRLFKVFPLLKAYAL